MSERMCGTCEHWNLAKTTSAWWGFCEAPISSISCLDGYKKRTTDDVEGVNCPLWQAKETSE